MDTAAGDQPAVPAPVDDGDLGHLVGVSIPPLVLPSTDGPVDLATLAADRLVLYIYPRTGRPGEPPAPGWDKVPGALGCTAQSCAFRDSHSDLTSAGARVVGLSAQALDEQVEFRKGKDIPFRLISDADVRLADSLGLPTFEFAGQVFYRRMTLVAEHGEIVKVFYPVATPEANAEAVLTWLRGRP
jgi:peroxiredoxin